MKYKPTDDEREKIFNPAYEDIMSICDDLDIETKCGNEFIIEFLENIVEDYKILVKQLKEEEAERGWYINNYLPKEKLFLEYKSINKDLEIKDIIKIFFIIDYYLILTFYLNIYSKVKAINIKIWNIQLKN